MHIGPHHIEPPLALAPMAGITDKPFRILAKRFGAGLCVSEMVAAAKDTWNTTKSRRRRDHEGEPEPIAVQIAGYCPDMLADAARFNVDEGAQIIDINMGCPAKKVCKIDAGSALMRDEALVERILHATASAVDVPVTLKIRTGWSREEKNAVTIAKIAEDAGIAALAIHGRTRADRFKGDAEYDTIRAVKQAVSIPIWANGDILDPVSAKDVLAKTGADGLMLGRGAQGKPWIFQHIQHYFNTGDLLPAPSFVFRRDLLLEHLDALHVFYGEYTGVRVARKHFAWYCADHPESQAFRKQIVRVDCAKTQRQMVVDHFDQLIESEQKEAA